MPRCFLSRLHKVPRCENILIPTVSAPAVPGDTGAARHRWMHRDNPSPLPPLPPLPPPFTSRIHPTDGPRSRASRWVLTWTCTRGDDHKLRYCLSHFTSWKWSFCKKVEVKVTLFGFGLFHFITTTCLYSYCIPEDETQAVKGGSHFFFKYFQLSSVKRDLGWAVVSCGLILANWQVSEPWDQAKAMRRHQNKTVVNYNKWKTWALK